MSRQSVISIIISNKAKVVGKNPYKLCGHNMLWNGVATFYVKTLLTFVTPPSVVYLVFIGYIWIARVWYRIVPLVTKDLYVD